jgi:spore coat polysaccharide biosynthesis protein SpsF
VRARLPLEDEPLVFRVMEALLRVPADLHILACPEDAKEAFALPAKRAGFLLFTGPKDDVLARYAAAVRFFELVLPYARIIRATGDNPFVFADAAWRINEEAAALDADYSAYSGLPYGAGVESVAVKALLRADNEAHEHYEREHVCPYLYTKAGFKLHRPLAPKEWQADYSVTVDTKDEYERAIKFYNLLPKTEERYLGATINKHLCPN